MLKLIIEDDEGRKTPVPFVREEITIGRQEGNTIRLTERNVSRRHARLLRQNGHVLIEDLGSYNGIYINGERIKAPVPVQDGDLIQIGDYDLAIQSDGLAAPPPGPPALPERTVEEMPAALSEAATEPPLAPPTPLLARPPPAMSAHPTLVDELAVASTVGSELQNMDLPAMPPPPPPAARATSIIHAAKLDGLRPAAGVESEELDTDQAPRLVVLNTNIAGQEFVCIRTDLRLGRADDTDNDIAVDHRSLSRSHAQLVRSDRGEWRIVDLGSANGLKVNGETYAEAALSFGDTFELGHVKFKFLGPHDKYTFVPEEEQARRQSMRKVLLVMLVVLLGVVFAAGAILKRAGRLPPMAERFAESLGLAKKPPPPPPPPETPRSEHLEPPLDAARESAGTEDEEPSAGSNTPPAVQLASDQEKLEAARTAMGAKDYDRALEVLGSIQSTDAVTVKQREALTRAAQNEADAKKAMRAAQRALTEGNAGKAQQVLEGIHTEAQATELEALREQLRAAPKSAVTPTGIAVPGKDEEPGTQTPSADEPIPAVAGAAGGDAQRAEQYLSEGKQLFLRGRPEHDPDQRERLLRRSLGKFEDCVKLLPSHPGCRMMLGSAHAELQELDAAAAAYREFIRLTPNNPAYATFRAKVRRYLDGYQQQKRGKSDTP